ncbi:MULTISPECIES: HNH endonuclease family protein [Nocardiopsis]|uniref:HNH endonuclease n=1 Tax=Nocardiopsis changdeensis TaxID=2831969 RepID=A0ABX8BR05_9ACTN|nr:MULTISPECIES: HNH endonuclease family protein [Nocardiopsis]QUX24556.1 HNH endonuclease [Nocardiopsis changdeensis]QYX34944.1 HNH endonuclease family protein [Nocardiopsis sp. MT53]
MADKKSSSKLGGIISAVVGAIVVAAFVLYQLGIIDLGLEEDTGAPRDGAPSSPSGDVSVEQARTMLDELTVEAENDPPGYDRAMFPHWSSQDGCDTRQTVLERSGENVEMNEDCRAVSGSWYSAYDGETFTDPQDLDIDHMVPLKEGWRSGAHAWTTEERERFANDLESSPQLWAVSATTNRSKGDADPADWMPPLESVHCEYAAAWIEVKHVWDLSVDTDEEAALRGVLDGC